jgi:replicative DNA helicase
MSNFETIAISKLLHGDVELIPDISLAYFSGHNQALYKRVLEYYSENHELPTANILKGIIGVRAPTHLRGGLMALVDAAEKADTAVSNEVLTNSLKDAFILRGVDQQMDELIEAQRSTDAVKVKGILSALLEDISIQNVKIGDFIDEIENDDHFTVVPSGLGKDFDELIGGGYSGLTVVTAKSGHGKSILLQQCAVESYKAGLNVLYLSLELSPKVLGNRIKSYISGISFGAINSGKITDDELKTVNEEMRKVFHPDRDNIWRVTASPVDTDELLNIIKVEKQLHNINVVVIDYLALISPSKYDRGEGWVTISNLVKKLHKYTMQENIVIVTASQVNEVKKAKDGVEPEITTRGSKEIEFSATQMYYIEKENPEDAADSAMRYYQIKNRLAKKVHSIVEGDFATMRVIDSNIRLN